MPSRIEVHDQFSISQLKKLNLPSVSVSELQKTYANSLQNLHRFKKHTHSNSSLLPLKTEQDLQIKSAFYRRICQKRHCKCEFHKRQKTEVPKFESLRNKRANPLPLNCSSNHRTMTVEAEAPMRSNPLKLKSLKSRFKSLAEETQSINESRENLFEQIVLNALRNSKVSVERQINLDDAERCYEQYIKNLRKSGTSGIDCYNIPFEQFLKTHFLCILKKNTKTFPKYPNSGKGFNRSKKKLSENRMPSHFSDVSESDSISQKSKKNNRSKNQQHQEESAIRLKTTEEGQGTHRRERKKNKKNTQVNFKREEGSCDKEVSRPRYSFSGLSATEQLQGERAIKDLYSCLKDLKSERGDSEQEKQLMALIVSKLMSEDPQVVEEAKKALRRLSRLPLRVFEQILNGFKFELQGGLQLEEFAEKRIQDVKQSIELALDLMGKQIEENGGDKQAPKKLKLLNRLKRNYLSRCSIYTEKVVDRKRRKESQQIRSGCNQASGHSLSRFSKANKQSSSNKEPELSERESHHSAKPRSREVTDRSQGAFAEEDLQGKPSVQKKGKHLKKKQANKQILREIEREINSQNQKISSAGVSHSSAIEAQQYMKRRAESRQRQREEESRKHRNFLEEVKRKGQNRHSSVFSEYELKKNNLRAHFQRHKLFIKKMQICLSSCHLKDVVINFEDDLLTKKRKMRLIQEMLREQDAGPDVNESEFCKDIRKYLNIYQKNCSLIANRDRKRKEELSRTPKGSVLRKNFGKFSDNFFQYPYETEEHELKGPVLELEFRNFLRMNHNLKFYSLNEVKFEEEDMESLVIKIPTSVSEKKSRAHHQDFYLPSHLQGLEFQNPSDSGVLVQKGIEDKCAATPFGLILAHHNCDPLAQKLESESEDPHILRLKENFDRKMQRYRKILRSCVHQS